MGQAAFEYTGYYTVAEWEHWQDQWELINGLPYCMSPAPNLRHQRISKYILRELDKQIETCGKCEAFLPIDWQISEDTVVQPDISVVCREVSGIRLLAAPTAIFEILSPSTQKKDRTTKFELYENQGVTYYIIVDPEAESIEVFRLNNAGKYELLPFKSMVEFDFEGCKVILDLGLIW